MQNQYQPAPPATGTASAPARRCGGGCLKGCAITAGVLGGLLVLLVLFVLIFGRSILGRSLPALEARYPLLGPALDLTGLRARLTPKVDVQKLQRGRQKGENERGLVPADIVLYANPTLETYSVSRSQVTGYQRVQAPLDEVRAYLLAGMAAQGWELLAERTTERGAQLQWAKTGRNCQVDLVTVQNGTEIWLRSNPSS